MAYHRYVLILDDEKERLGDLALRLVRMRVDALYSKDPDEASLLARQESRGIGALLVPAETPLETLRGALERVASHASVSAHTLVPVGVRPSDESLAELRELGVRWALWRPFDDLALRFVTTLAMAAEHEVDPRQTARVPISLAGIAYKGARRKEVRVHNLSASGAYLATEGPFLEGTQVSLELQLPDALFFARATVRHVIDCEDEVRPHLPMGMGVSFADLDFETLERLHALLGERMARFEL